MAWLAARVALVTGGASGIGQAVVERFVREGAKVVVFDHNAGALTALEARWPRQVVGVAGDVTRWSDNEAAVARAIDAFGRLDVFVGNAGVFDGFVRLVDVPGEALDRGFADVFNVNVKGYLLGARAAARALIQAKGSIILTTSSAGRYAGAGGAIYTASKHAVVGLIRQLAHELAPHVRVNGVAPGGTVSGLQSVESLKAFSRDMRPDLTREERVRIANPLGLLMQPEDHAGAYVLLASEQARAITGTVIESDGGLGARGLWDAAGGRDL
jgi:NAD(P)-dependent dehydrogenase (short-subunit alcohol dehydrogenase family)